MTYIDTLVSLTVPLTYNFTDVFISSSLSTSLNSMSAVVLEDFYKPFFKKELSERQTNWLLRGVVVLLGVLCVGKYYP